MEKLQDLDLSEAYDMLPVSLRETASFYEMNVFSQKREFAEEHKSGSGGFRTEQASVPAEIEQVVPGISIQLFGGFTVRRDGLEMDPDLFSRQKVKILLAILAIEQGKDVPCDRLASLMWPDSDPLDARKNLQSTWSLLRKALKTPQGTCPYLRKSPFSYQLTDYFVITDVSIFKDLCRKVQFESSESTEWAHVSMRLDDVYRGELFPTEQCNDAIVSARRDCEMRLVNCCFQAGLRLFDLKDYEMAIWFLQKTISHDPTREDAYQLMMRAQLELGQRAAAIETFFRCEKRMHENLGIRPGPRIRMLYQEIIMESKNEKSLLKQLENNAIDGL
jgi:DNA-binding SARP family transcriptional activator